MHQVTRGSVSEDFQEEEDIARYAEDEVETLYVYVYEDDPHKPRLSPKRKETIIALVEVTLLLLCIVGICLLPNAPGYTVQTLTLPAHFSMQEFKADVAIIPTGRKTYPATKAYGVLTIYNGSAFVQSLHAGFIVTTQSGIEIATDQAVTIPGANLPTPGETSVSAYAVVPGASGNIAPYAIQTMYGSDIEIKNLSAFTSGQDTFTKTYATSEDQQKALETARQQLTTKQPVGPLARPCTEMIKQSEASVSVSWQCQYVTYPAPTNGQVVSVHLSGNNVIIRIKIIERMSTIPLVK